MLCAHVAAFAHMAPHDARDPDKCSHARKSHAQGREVAYSAEVHQSDLCANLTEFRAAVRVLSLDPSGYLGCVSGRASHGRCAEGSRRSGFAGHEKPAACVGRRVFLKAPRLRRSAPSVAGPLRRPQSSAAPRTLQAPGRAGCQLGRRSGCPGRFEASAASAPEAERPAGLRAVSRPQRA